MVPWAPKFYLKNLKNPADLPCLILNVNLLNEANDSKFVKRKWSIVNANSNTNYGVGSEVNI